MSSWTITRREELNRDAHVARCELMRQFRAAAHADRWQDVAAFRAWIRGAGSEIEKLYKNGICCDAYRFADQRPNSREWGYDPTPSPEAEAEYKRRTEALALTDAEIKEAIEQFDVRVAQKMEKALRARDEALPLQEKILAAATLPEHARSDEQVKLAKLKHDLEYYPSEGPGLNPQPVKPARTLITLRGAALFLAAVALLLVLMAVVGMFSG